MRRIVSMALGAAFAVALGAANVGAASPPSGADPDLQESQPPPAQMVKPEWRSLPSGDDMAKVYPNVAQRMNLSGKASIRCEVNTNGRLQNCAVVSESPAGFDFGSAALRLAANFSMTPARRDGQPVTSIITIPIRFALAGQTPTAAEPEPPPPTSAAALVLARKVLALQGASDRLKAQARPAIARLLSEAMLSGGAPVQTAAVGAYQKGLDDVVDALIERHAKMMAASMTEAQLNATIDYLESPAGSAWRAVGIAVTPSADFLSRVAEAAANHLCVGAACGAKVQPR